MATQVIGRARRTHRGAVLIAVALTFAVAVLLAQATSIWSSESGSHSQPVTQVSLSPQHYANVGHVPQGCRPKYGCPGGSALEGP
jgi:hypothetical protein